MAESTTPTSNFTWWVSKVSGTPRPNLDSDWSQITLGTDDDEDVVNPTGAPTTEYMPRGKRAADETPNTPNNVAVDEGKFLRVVAEYYDTHRTA